MQNFFPIPLALSLLAGALTLAASSPANAVDAPVKGEVLVILAKEAAGDYDAKLKQMPALQKAPFSAFKSMTILSTNPVELSDKEVSVTLPNERTLHLKLLERVADGRHRVQVTIRAPGKKEHLQQFTVLASAEPFFVAGQSHAGGTLVIGVRIGAAAATKK